MTRRTPFLPRDGRAQTATERSTSQRSIILGGLPLAGLSLIISVLVGIAAKLLYQPGYTKCGRTKIFPFHIGCPSDCSRIRPDLANQSFYLVPAYWNFGDLDPFRPNTSVIPSTAFHGASKLARTFLETETRLRSRLHANIEKMGLEPLVVKKQEFMHMSLSYICCLTKDETVVVKTIIDKWTAKNTFPKPVKFTKLECLHQRRNSVTVILDLDAESEAAVMKLNLDLKATLEQAGVKVWIDRKDQMPFHTTIVGFQRDHSLKDISPYLAPIGSVVKNADHLRASAQIKVGLSTETIQLTDAQQGV